MPALALRSVEEAAGFLAARGCTALRADSRQVRVGEGFIAWPGFVTDGRRFVDYALAAGAAACVVEAEGAEAFGFDDPRIAALPALKAATGPLAAAFHGQPSARLSIVAVTGTNGKTSTAWWVAQGLSALQRRCGLIGTLGVGEPPGVGAAAADQLCTLQSTGLTTPDPVTLQATLARFVDDGFAACAIEASSIGIVEQRLAGCEVALALFTNFTRDHLDYHGSMQAYWAAKRQLFTWPGLKAAVINIDDEHGAQLAGECRAAGLPLWTVALEAEATLTARALRHHRDGLAFELCEGGQVHAVQTSLVGRYNVSNLLVVAGALRALGVALADVASLLPRLTPVPGRLEPVPHVMPGPAVLVDYAHTPDALQQVLQALRPLAAARGGRLWCVFGCGGNRDASKRPLMGGIAHRLADQVVLTSDNPRHEAPAAILADILAGLPAAADTPGTAVIEDRAAAIAHAVRQAALADVIVLAGKGHEPYQEVAGQRLPFADAGVAAAALQRRAHEVAA